MGSVCTAAALITVLLRNNEVYVVNIFTPYIFIPTERVALLSPTHLLTRSFVRTVMHALNVCSLSTLPREGCAGRVDTYLRMNPRALLLSSCPSAARPVLLAMHRRTPCSLPQL